MEFKSNKNSSKQRPTSMSLLDFATCVIFWFLVIRFIYRWLTKNESKASHNSTSSSYYNESYDEKISTLPEYYHARAPRRPSNSYFKFIKDVYYWVIDVMTIEKYDFPPLPSGPVHSIDSILEVINSKLQNTKFNDNQLRNDFRMANFLNDPMASFGGIGYPKYEFRNIKDFKIWLLCQGAPEWRYISEFRRIQHVNEVALKQFAKFCDRPKPRSIDEMQQQMFDLSKLHHLSAIDPYILLGFLKHGLWYRLPWLSSAFEEVLKNNPDVDFIHAIHILSRNPITVRSDLLDELEDDEYEDDEVESDQLEDDADWHVVKKSDVKQEDINNSNDYHSSASSLPTPSATPSQICTSIVANQTSLGRNGDTDTPWSTISIGVYNGLNEIVTADNVKTNALLLIVDHYSLKAYFYPIHATFCSDDYIRHLLRYYLAQHGKPRMIYTLKAPIFTSMAFETFLHECGIIHFIRRHKKYDNAAHWLSKFLKTHYNEQNRSDWYPLVLQAQIEYNAAMFSYSGMNSRREHYPNYGNLYSPTYSGSSIAGKYLSLKSIDKLSLVSWNGLRVDSIIRKYKKRATYTLIVKLRDGTTKTFPLYLKSSKIDETPGNK